MLIPTNSKIKVGNKYFRVYTCKGGFCIGRNGKVYKTLVELIQKSGD